MRKHISPASAILAIVLAAAACSSSTPSASGSPTPTCVNASAPHHAYVVVEHLSGQSVQKCVGFTGDTIAGQSLMDQSGINFQTQTFSFGKARAPSTTSRLSSAQCLPQERALLVAVRREAGGAWTTAQTGYTDVTLHDKDALGWHYVQATDASPAPPPLANES